MTPWKMLLGMLYCVLVPGVVPAGETLWNGQKDTFTFTSRIAGQHKELQENTLHFYGKNETKEYEYLVMQLPVTPFRFGGRSLAVDFALEAPCPDDSFYVKCLSKDRKIVASFMTRNVGPEFKNFVMTPGRGGSSRVQSLDHQVTEPENTPVAFLQIFVGRQPGKPAIAAKLRNIALVKTLPPPQVGTVKDFGIGINSAELRNSAAFLDAQNHPYVIGAPLDVGKPYLLVTDALTGKTEQYYVPNGVSGAIFGAALTQDGKYVFGLSQNLIFDVNTRTYTVAGKGFGSSLCAGIAPDGTVYLGSAPQSVMFAIDPEKGTSKNLGRMDDEEDYLNTIAVDKEGIVYCGIGTARSNVVAYDPKTGKRTSLVPEAARQVGSGSVIACKDGTVYATCGSFAAKCLGGKVIAENVPQGAAMPHKLLKYGTHLQEFGNGMKVVDYDFPNRKLTVRNADGSSRTFDVKYASGGLELTSMALGPDGKVYFSSAHPNHLGRIDPEKNTIEDLGYNSIVEGGNFCNMVAHNGKLYACEYAGGRLWEYSPELPYAIGDGSSKDIFGMGLNELKNGSSVKNGHFSIYQSPRILLGIAAAADNAFVLNLPVDAPKDRYLNVQLFEYASYGTVTIETCGVKKRVNLQKTAEGSLMLTMGPLSIPDHAKTLPVTFTVEANDNESSKPMFSVQGIEFAVAPRETPVKPETVSNPRILGQWESLVTRPRTIAVHPSGKEVVIGGFAGYGLTGGGLGIHNLETHENRKIEVVLPGESCIAMDFLPDGNLAGGTSIEAPGGGHTKAKQASIFLLDWPSGKVTKNLKTNSANVIAVTCWNHKIFAVTAESLLYVVNPTDFSLEKTIDVSSGHWPLRNSFQKTADGKLFLVMAKMIYVMDPQTNEPKEYVMPPISTALTNCSGPILGKRLFFIKETCKVSSMQMP